MATNPSPGESSRLLNPETTYRTPETPSMSSVIAQEDDETRGKLIIKFPIRHIAIQRLVVIVLCIVTLVVMFKHRSDRGGNVPHITFIFLLIGWSAFALIPHRRNMKSKRGFRLDCGFFTCVCGNPDSERDRLDEPEDGHRKKVLWRLLSLVDCAWGVVILTSAIINASEYLFHNKTLITIFLFIITILQFEVAVLVWYSTYREKHLKVYVYLEDNETSLLRIRLPVDLESRKRGSASIAA